MTKSQVYLAALLENAPSIDLDRHLPKGWREDSQLKSVLEVSRDLSLGKKDAGELDAGVPLASVYNELLRHENQTKDIYYYKAEQLNIKMGKGDQFFPSTKNDFQEVEVSKLWEKLNKDILQLSKSDDAILAECVLTLLKKYTVNLHCGFKDSACISYFDYAKSRAGIAVCLWEWLIEPGNGKTIEDIKKGSLQEKRFPDGEKIVRSECKPFLLVGGDLSGIQTFIYDIISKNAAKNLKGRSFYLQLLVSSVIQKLLQELGLFQCNIVFDSGGGFNLIVPNTKDNRDKINVFRKKVANQLFEEHKTVLSLGLEVEEMDYFDLLEGRVSQVQRALADKLNIAKYRKHEDKVLHDYEVLFGKDIEPANGVKDVVTGQPIVAKKGREPYKFDAINGLGDKLINESEWGYSPSVNFTTAIQIKIGQKLKDIKYWVSFPTDINNPFQIEDEEVILIDTCFLGITNILLTSDNLDKKNLFQFFKEVGLQEKPILVHQINRFEVVPELLTTSNISFKFILYGGDKFPTVPVQIRNWTGNIPKTFSEMAGAMDEDRMEQYVDFQESEFKRLGVLRMDVDDLGYIFRKGFWKDHQTPGHLPFGKYATLSRSMDFFFKGYLNTIWETGKFCFEDKQEKKWEDIKDNAQIIYAGGDDLFVVGRWHLMIRFAELVRESFHKWTCNNTKLSISGGVSIVTHKYPIMKAADKAGEAESTAKKHNDYEKKAFTLLGTPLQYRNQDGSTSEYDIVQKLKNELITKITQEKLSRGILQKIMMLEGMRQESTRLEQNPKWQWTTAYYFSKTAEDLRRRGKKELFDYLKDRSKDILFNQNKGNMLNSNYSFLQLYALAARWAELEHRQLY